MNHAPAHCTAFDGSRQVAAGPCLRVALAVKALLALHPGAAVLIFDDDTGRQVDFDLRGTDRDVAARLGRPADAVEVAGATRKLGRPKLGVVAREVTLLPRHWEWLAAQPGGASVALRKLVDEARRTQGSRDASRAAQERAYNFMSAIGGNLPGFEEAARALFADDRPRLRDLVAPWPGDVRDHVVRLAFGGSDALTPQETGR